MPSRAYDSVVTAHSHSTIVLLSLVAMAMVWLDGCSGHQRPDPSSRVPISDFKTVAGKWEGTVWKVPNMARKASVVLIIDKNSAFTFVGQDFSRMALGSGTFTLQDGLLISDSFGRYLRLGLYDRESRSVLAGDARTKDGEELFAELTRTSTSP